MADFNTFFPTLLEHEGGFVSDPTDPGGATNLGITVAAFRQCAKPLLGIEPTLDNLRELTPPQAAAIYKPLYWDRVQGDLITLQPLANILFDFYVNAGAHAVRLLQRVLNAIEPASPLAEDGAFGQATLARLDSVDQLDVYRRYKQGRAGYYRQLVTRRPELGEFLKGWLARVASFPDL